MIYKQGLALIRLNLVEQKSQIRVFSFWPIHKAPSADTERGFVYYGLFLLFVISAVDFLVCAVSILLYIQTLWLSNASSLQIVVSNRAFG